MSRIIEERNAGSVRVGHCGMGFYGRLWLRLLSVPCLLLPAWGAWFARRCCICWEARRHRRLAAAAAAAHGGDGDAALADGDEPPVEVPAGEEIVVASDPLHRPRTPAAAAATSPSAKPAGVRSATAALARQKMRAHGVLDAAMAWSVGVVVLSHPSVTRAALEVSRIMIRTANPLDGHVG